MSYSTVFGQTFSNLNGTKSYGSTQVATPVYRYSGVSEGCFLINRSQFSSFMNHFPSGVGRIGVIK